MVTTLSRARESKEWIMQLGKGPERAKAGIVVGRNIFLSTWKEVKMRAMRADEMLMTNGVKNGTDT